MAMQRIHKKVINNKLYQNACTFYAKYPSVLLWIIFIIAWGICSYVFFLRFPNNLLFPNFFAEDGQHFVTNIINDGFIGALITPFNGYFIFGIYILTEFGFMLNSLFLGGEFITLPMGLALSSYIFLGLCAALPIVLLKKWISLPYRLAIALLIVLLPMPSFDYGTIGTIGNLKFAFNYIAVLLVLYRATLPRTSKKIILVDICLAIGAFTTAGVYLILPFILASDGLQIYKRAVRKKLKDLFKRDNISLWSGVGLAVASFVQVAYIVIKGVPKFPGYLDEPYKVVNTIEVFIARSYLYPGVSALYHHLTNLFVVLLFIGICLLGYKYFNRKRILVYIVGISAILTTSLVFVINRTGTAYYYDNYKTTGFDNFFYAQNFIGIILIVFLIYDMSTKIKWFNSLYLPLLLVALLAAGSIRSNSVYAPNDFMQYQIGTLEEQVKPQCDAKKESITFSVYPFKFLTMTEPQERICNDSLGDNNNIENPLLLDTGTSGLNISPKTDSFTQTFTADRDGLHGLGIYLGTYYQPVLKNYELVLMDSTCEHTLRSLEMPRYVRDNAFRTISFEPLEQSAGQKYCLTIQAKTDDSQPLALRLSDSGLYAEGDLTVNDIPSNRDIVFSLLYK